MNDPTPISEPLDTFLRDIVTALHAAVNRGIQSAEKDPPTTDRTIQDCKEILDVIMAGHVEEWIAA